MERYIIRRLLQFLPSLFAVAILVFFMTDLAPGDPVGIMLGTEASEESMANLRASLGLDRPLHERLLNWLADAVRGDLGTSLFLHQPVSEALKERYRVTASMTVLALGVALGLGVPMGLIAAVKQGRLADWISSILSLLVLSAPSFWLALNLIFFFGVKLQWLPVGGWVDPTEDPIEFLKHMAMPCISLGLSASAMIARMTRSSMLEVLRMDYVRTAQAKGLRQLAVVLRHALKNALLPIITVVGLTLGSLLGGSAITETVYSLPGVGRLIVEGVGRRDYFVVQGGILALTATYLLVNLAVDISYAVVDPRIRYE